MMTKWKFNRKRIQRKLWVGIMLRWIIYIVQPTKYFCDNLRFCLRSSKPYYRYSRVFSPLRSILKSITTFFKTYITKESFERSMLLVKFIEKNYQDLQQKDLDFIYKELLRIESQTYVAYTDFVSDKEGWLRFRDAILSEIETDEEFFPDPWKALAGRISYCSDRWNSFRIHQVKFGYLALREQRIQELLTINEVKG